MTTSEVVAVGEDVLAEYLPKTKAGDRSEAMKALVEELQAQGLELEDDSEEEGDPEGEAEAALEFLDR
jgi:hypothetical protein